MPSQTPATPTTPPSALPAPRDAAPEDAPPNLEQQVDDLLAELEATQQKVEQAMQDPPTEAQVDLAALEAAVQQASATSPNAEPQTAPVVEPAADALAATDPDLELTDDLVTACDDDQRSDAGLEDIVEELVTDSAPVQTEVATDEPADGEAGEPELVDDPDQVLLDEQSAETLDADAGVTENDVVEALAEDLNDLLEDLPQQPSAGTVAGEQAAGFFETQVAESEESSSANHEALDADQSEVEAEASPVDAIDKTIDETLDAPQAATPPPGASKTPKVAVPPTGAGDALADLDRAIAQTATEMIKAEAPAAPPEPPPVATAPKEPAPAAPVPTASVSPKAKAATFWLWTRVEPKLHDGVALLAKPLHSKPARTRHALGLVGVYTLIVGAACWGWAMFLRPDTAASAAVEPFDFQKSGLPAPEHKEHHDEHATAAHETKEAGGHGEAKSDSKDGKKKPLLNSGDGKSVINKTMDERAKKAKDAAKGGKAEAKKSGGH